MTFENGPQPFRITGKNPQDPRAVKTRQAIFDAVTTLMSTRKTPVSIGDIARAADISRSSFYAHFGSLDQLAIEFLRFQLSQVGDADLDQGSDDALADSSAARLGYRRLIAHMVENYPLYASVLELPLSRNAHDAIVEVYARRLLESLLLVERAPSGVMPAVVATYLAGGALTLIGSWIRGDVDLSDDEIVDQLVELLPAWLVDSPLALPRYS